MNKAMIHSSTNFQTSINISYDLGNTEKLKDFIPTNEAVQLLEDILLSTEDKENANRARILIGAYGKGKSYIVLEILSFLNSMSDDRGKFKPLLSKIKEYKSELYEYVNQYIDSHKRLLPIVINGSSASLTQSFLYALHSTLKQKEFEHLMPETHFEAAVNMIDLWCEKFPETYKAFNRQASVRAELFKDALNNYDGERFEEFEELYPKLTSGSAFNPFAGFDVVDLYSEVTKKLPENGYNGIYVVYDEFGKYLESSISKATIKDIKLLQDFAEKCNRSGKNQLHLMLICHKEIENYIDTLPKQKVDGWKGVSERFVHIHLHNHYSEAYELIKAAIVKDDDLWTDFQSKHETQFSELEKNWKKQRVFSDVDGTQIKTIVRGCYPLHPVTTYILPRISEKVAQNERTLFTFLSAEGRGTFSSLLSGKNYMQNGKVLLLTPDILYDYFEWQMQSEPYTSEIKKWRSLSALLLQKLENNPLEIKIIKTLTLIYILNQFERLQPASDLILAIYGDAGIPFEEIKNALVNLTQKLGIVYERISGARYLQLKEASGVDIPQTILDLQEKRKNNVSDCGLLNSLNVEQFLYPVEYNTDFAMTRYFQFVFIEAQKVFDEFDWNVAVKATSADGIVFALLPDTKIESVEKKVLLLSGNFSQTVFVLPRKQDSIQSVLRQYDAVSILRESSSSDKVLFSEYDIIYQDLLETIRNFIYQYTQPEKNAVMYISDGEKKNLYRKSNLTALLSEKCNALYPNTPVINNEMLNKNNLTSAAYNSRLKLLNGILNSSRSDLGLSGSGQEVSFMRSALIVPGILTTDTFEKYFNLVPKTKNAEYDRAFKNLFTKIEGFITKSKKSPQNFTELYNMLTGSDKKIGLRRGVIPIFFASVLSKYLKNVVVRDTAGEVPVTAETISTMVENPQDYTVSILEWNSDREKYVAELESLFKDFIIAQEKTQNGYAFLTNAFVRWYRSLPKYVKQVKKQYTGNGVFTDVSRENIKFIETLRQPFLGAQEILFEKFPSIFGEKEFAPSVFGDIQKTKKYFDLTKTQLETVLIRETGQKLSAGKKKNVSLKSTCSEFLRCIPEETKSRVFDNGAQKLITIFENAGNDDVTLVESLAFVLTGLSIDDWTDETVHIYFNRLDELKQTLVSYAPQTRERGGENDSIEKSDYKVQFIEGNGSVYEKSFSRVDCSRRAQVLGNELNRTIEEIGQSVTDSEKRQVLMNLLEKLC
jgi:hypothetical protein